MIPIPVGAPVCVPFHALFGPSDQVLGCWTVKRAGRPVLSIVETTDGIRAAPSRVPDMPMLTQDRPPAHVTLDRLGDASAPVDGVFTIKREPAVPSGIR